MFNVYIYEIFIDVKFVYVYIVFTTRGEGEHTRHTSRKVATTTREEEAGLGGMKAVADTVGGARGRPESSKEARETGDVKTGRVGTAGRGWSEPGLTG